MKKNTDCKTILKTLALLGLLMLGKILNAQTIVSANIISPVCSKGSGSIELTFASGTTYPFTLNWTGSNVQSGSVVITGSPQTITINGSTTGYGNGAVAQFYYNNFNKYLGQFPVGITFDYLQGIRVTCSAGGVINLKNLTGGTGPYMIELYDKSTNTLIASGSNPLTVGYSALCPAAPRVMLRVIDNNGCYVQSDSIYVSCVGLELSMSSTMASCTNGTVTVNSIVGGVAPYSYLWSNGATTNSISGLVTGSYNCIATDANGCSGMGYAYVEQNPYISVNFTQAPANCNNADGQATAFPDGGITPYVYSWDNGSTTQTANNLAEGYHQIKVTDANGCIGTNSVYISSLSPVYVNYSTTPSSCTSPTGGASLNVSGGQAPYTYKWYGLSSTTSSVSGLAVGNYSFTVTDANGCIRTGTVFIPPISQLSAYITQSNPVCPSTAGSLSVFASSTATPITYLWSNGATTSTISNVSVGWYTCKITDANGCEVNKSGYLYSQSPIQVGFSSTPASCIYTADGSITATPTGGTAPYTYKWSNGATTATVNGLLKGVYSVTVTDANGCTNVYPNNYINLGHINSNACYCTIEGTVYYDVNGDCAKGTGEDGMENILIDGGTLGYTLTDQNGNYSFLAPIGSYTIKEILDKGNSLSTCQSNSIAVNVTSVGNCTQTVNFANNITPHHDLCVLKLDLTGPIPGNDYIQQTIISNIGNITETDIQANTLNDGQLSWLTSFNPSYVSDGTNKYKLSSPLIIKKSQYTAINNTYFTPTNIPLGTTVYFRDTVSYKSPLSTYWITNEETPWNNITDQWTTVRSSFDPNYKSVSPKGVGETGKIDLTNKNFTYVIHFENNGTAPAQNIVVTDSLDSDFDLESFRTIESSHNVNTRVKNGVVTFTFKNINLDYTPKGVYKGSAQGYVAYTIKAKNSVVIGTKLENNADIYFDYNVPIRTNTTVNTYSTDLTLNNTNLKTEQVKLYPNPGSNKVYLEFPNALSGSKNVSLVDMNGRVLQSETINGELGYIEVSKLVNGLYFVQIQSENGVKTVVKFMKN